MENFNWIMQPPLAEKVTFLVDQIGPRKNWAKTTDIEKINYNRGWFGVDFNMTVGIRTSLALSGGISTVARLGRYITIIRISQDEQTGVMDFFDYQVDIPHQELRKMLNLQYSPALAEIWLSHRAEMLTNFTEANDFIQLLKL